MEIILKQDVQNLGFKDDVVSVKPGYGRNFLIPQGFATLATPSAKKVLAENLKQRALYICNVSYENNSEKNPAKFLGKISKFKTAIIILVSSF